MSAKKSGTWIWVIVALLVILHQDNWLWNNDTLVFGFIPIGLFYHACLSLGAATTWFLATKFAWPDELEVDASTPSAEGAHE